MTDERSDLAAHVTLLKTIADETRLRILGLLSEREHTGKELAERLELTAPTVSHHMRKLVDAGIVTSTTDAQRHIYGLNTALLRDVRTSYTSARSSEEAPRDER